MKRFFAMLLVFMLLSGSLFSHAEEIETEELGVVEDGAGESAEEWDAVIGEEGLLLGDEDVGSEDGELALDLEGDGEQQLLDLVEEQAPVPSGAAGNDIVRNDAQGTFTVENGVLTAWSSEDTVTVLTIPEDLGITEIGANCFSGKTGLQIVILPSAVTVIGEKAFFGCVGLQQVSLPDALQRIGAESFSGCVGLRSIRIPDN